MKVVVATVTSTLILWWRASLLASPTVVPASTVPWRCIAPVRARIASRSVVLPLWNGPTSAIHRGPLGPLSLSPINCLPRWSRSVPPPGLCHYRFRGIGALASAHFDGGVTLRGGAVFLFGRHAAKIISTAPATDQARIGRRSRGKRSIA